MNSFVMVSADSTEYSEDQHPGLNPGLLRAKHALSQLERLFRANVDFMAKKFIVHLRHLSYTHFLLDIWTVSISCNLFNSICIKGWTHFHFLAMWVVVEF